MAPGRSGKGKPPSTAAKPTKSSPKKVKPQKPKKKAARKVNAGGLSAAEIRQAKAWADSIPPPDLDEPDNWRAKRLDNIRGQLAREHWPKKVLDKLQTIHADRWYMVSLDVEDYETDLPEDAPRNYGAPSRRRITFVGRGDVLLTKLLWLTETGTVVGARVGELAAPIFNPSPTGDDDGELIRPLFRGDSVHLLNGRRVQGSGTHKPRKVKVKSVRRTMAAADKRKLRRSEKEAKKRRAASDARARDLARSGDPQSIEAAHALIRRARAARKGATQRIRVQGSGVFQRMVPRPPIKTPRKRRVSVVKSGSGIFARVKPKK